MSARDIIAEAFGGGSGLAQFALDRLTAAGYRILAPGEIDKETVERCQRVIAERRALLHQQFEAVDISREDAVYRFLRDALRSLQDGSP